MTELLALVIGVVIGYLIAITDIWAGVMRKHKKKQDAEPKGEK